MHALRVEYARNGRGPKKRYYYGTRTNMTCDEWESELARPAHEGGMRCVKVNWPEMRKEYEADCDQYEELADTAEIRAAVEEDRRAMRRYLHRAPKRRAWPAWGVPAEGQWDSYLAFCQRCTSTCILADD